jgi:transcriptional regulator with XRE-family HTH domain
MSPSTEPLQPHRVIAERVKTLRKGRFTAAQLAEQMAAAGFRWDRFTVQNLENGRRATLSVEELLALAFVLDVAPIHLMVPTEDDGRLYAVTPEEQTPADEARAWIRGKMPLQPQDARIYFNEVPRSEWEPPSWSQSKIDADSDRVRKGRSDGR